MSQSMIPSLPLIDPFGRRIEYLRVSLTERCDLRCVYCRPPCEEGIAPSDILSVEDVVNIVEAAVGLGMCRLRLTGGEPLLRDDLEEIVASISALGKLQDIALTTNGQQLAARAGSLAAAGLHRVNVSVDSLEPAVYFSITGGGDLRDVLRGIKAASEAGLSPVKINVVLASRQILRRQALCGFVDLVQRSPVHVRFIEAMPTCSHSGYFPIQELLARLGEDHHLAPVPGPEGAGPARYYRVDGSLGTIGTIAPISAPFCDCCNRLRITARGELMPCLFSTTKTDLLPALRSPDPVPRLAALIAEAVASKPAGYGDIAAPSGIDAMYIIGG